MRTFAEKVLRVAAKIPRGKTLSYAQVAEYNTPTNLRMLVYRVYFK